LFSANPGEKPKDLSRIASGGEISRIMLGLKNLLGQKDIINTLIFDEVDVGIGGKTAVMVGEKLKNIATDHQIICITHLPQIARLADQHLVVDKIRMMGPAA
jgi:DNA repair protein RecN (Recombination protein N)